MSKGKPLRGDRSAWDSEDYPDFHARDIEDGKYTVHVPKPTADSRLLVSSSGGWKEKTLSGDGSLDADGKLTVTGLQGRGVSTTAPSDGQVLTWKASTNLWTPATPSGGGGGGLTKWDPDFPPETPSAMDDEFDDEQLNLTLWSRYNPTGTLQYLEDQRGLLIWATQTFAHGIYQPLPSVVPCCFWTKMGLLHYAGAWQHVILAIFTNAGDPSSPFWTVGLTGTWNSLVKYEVVRWARWNQCDYAAASREMPWGPTCVYARIRRIDSTTWDFDLSTDGVAWARFYRLTGYSAQHVGLLAWTEDTNYPARGWFRFFRMLETADHFALMPGRIG